MKKLQLWLRQDQAECIARALAYVSARFQEHGEKQLQQPAVKLACTLADERTEEVYDLIVEAIEKFKRRAPAPVSASK